MLPLCAAASAAPALLLGASGSHLERFHALGPLPLLGRGRASHAAAWPDDVPHIQVLCQHRGWRGGGGWGYVSRAAVLLSLLLAQMMCCSIEIYQAQN